MSPQRKLHFLIIDDDKSAVSFYTKLLEQAGQIVSHLTLNAITLEKIEKIMPDCILWGITHCTSEQNELLKNIRSNKNTKQIFLIVLSDREVKQNLSDGFLAKPINPNTFVDDIFAVIDNRIVVSFWGVRGTLPVPGKKTIRYGGNTNCILLTLGKNEKFIFDAGTGLKELSNYLIQKNHPPIKAKIFITHPHFDHIHGIPFFVPLYQKDNIFDIYGTYHDHLSIQQTLGSQMDSIHFPVTMKEFEAKITFHNLKEEHFKIDNISIKTIYLNHPGGSIGYRIDYRGKSFCYITDNELYLENSPHYKKEKVEELINFIYKTDMLVMDATYFDEEYTKKIGWGHASISRVVDVADRAQVKLLCLYHHDPDQYDKDIDLKLKLARTLLKSRNSKTDCIAPREGDKIDI